MQTRLAQLRNELTRLQTTRRMIRWGNGFSVLVTALILTLFIAFVSDLSLDMSRLQRVVLLGLVCSSAVWSFRRFTKPWLQQHEDLTEIALLVERQQRIDSDLVAAMQFEQPEAARWGSAQLETAVVTRVAEMTPKLNVFEGFSLLDFQRRVSVAVALALAVAVCWAANPGYVNAFLTRLLLGHAFYPTNTQIKAVLVNQTTVFEEHVLRDAIATPFGQPVKFEVTIDGMIPSPLAGKLVLQSLDGSIATDVELVAPEKTDQGKTVLRGELPRLMDSVQFEVYVGDARTVPFRINAVPLPVVDVRLKVTPPSYAAVAEFSNADSKGAAKWHLAVIEGSRVDVELESLNADLDSAKLMIGEHEFSLTPAGQGGARKWHLKPEGSPLASVSEPLEYKLQVTDQQGLQLEAPIRGSIRLKQDLPPRIAVSSRTNKVIPTATPPILYAVQDDYALAKVVAHVQVSRGDEQLPDREFSVVSVPESHRQSVAKGTYKLDLTALKLAKGDEVKVTFVASDYRGPREPKKSFSEPLLFHVTDQQGILSGLLETDQESAKQLDAIIRRELGISKDK